MPLQALEWIAAIGIALSILWYPSLRGWRRVAAPILGSAGGIGFFIVALDGNLYGIATLNLFLGLLNLWNLAKELRRRS